MAAPPDGTGRRARFSRSAAARAGGRAAGSSRAPEVPRARIRPSPLVRTMSARDAACVAATRIETHASVLTLEGDLVRKRKKAIRFPFMDLSTPDLRLTACANELELNRRLAPDVYLRVDEIRDPAGALVDAEVVMRRLPDERCLATLVASGADVTDELTQIAQLLAAFHATARRGPEVDRSATRTGCANGGMRTSTSGNRSRANCSAIRRSIASGHWSIATSPAGPSC